MASHWLPDLDATRDLGSAERRWRDGYLSGKIRAGDDIFVVKSFLPRLMVCRGYPEGVGEEAMFTNYYWSSAVLTANAWVTDGDEWRRWRTEFPAVGIDLRPVERNIKLRYVDAGANPIGIGEWAGWTEAFRFDLPTRSILFQPDTNLYRSDANVLKTDDNFDALALRIGGTEIVTSDRKLQNIASIAQTLLPDTDNTYDLGSATVRFRNIYCMAVDVGDVILKNGFIVSEKNNCIVIKNPEGREVFKVDLEGGLTVGVEED